MKRMILALIIAFGAMQTSYNSVEAACLAQGCSLGSKCSNTLKETGSKPGLNPAMANQPGFGVPATAYMPTFGTFGTLDKNTYCSKCGHLGSQHSSGLAGGSALGGLIGSSLF